MFVEVCLDDETKRLILYNDNHDVENNNNNNNGEKMEANNEYDHLPQRGTIT